VGMFEILTWLEVNKRRLIAAGVLIVALGVIIWLVRHFSAQKELNANSQLLSLRSGSAAEPGASAADYSKVADQFPGTSAAERAQLLAATTAFTENQYDVAHRNFTQFLSAHPESPFASAAAYGIAASLEAQGKQDEAVQGYQRVVTQFAKSAEVDDARLALARIYEAKNQPEQALRVLDEMMKPAAPGRSPDPEVVTRREAILKKHPQLRQAVTSTNAAAAPTTLSVPAKAAPSQATNK